MAKMSSFSSPAADFEESQLRIIDYLQKENSNIEVFEYQDISMSPRINKGDLLIIEKGKNPKKGKLGVFLYHDSHICGVYDRAEGCELIHFETEKSLKVEFDDDLICIGRVCHIIKKTS